MPKIYQLRKEFSGEGIAAVSDRSKSRSDGEDFKPLHIHQSFGFYGGIREFVFLQQHVDPYEASKFT